LKAIGNILLHRVGGTDPVTQGVNMVAHAFEVDIDVDLCAQQLSFLFIGALVVFSIRGLLIQLSKVWLLFVGHSL
jgi:hypothetical protein